MTTATALLASNPLTLNGAEPVWLDNSDGTLTGGATSQAIANLYKGTKGADLASAATVTLANATGNVIHITGTTTITSFGNASAGLERTVIFDGILTLTHNATSLILPTGANITTAAGDVARFVCDTTNNWRCLSYNRASGAGLASGDGLDADSVGFRGVPQNSQSSNYTCVASDAGKHLLHPSGGGSGDTFTIPANASVAFEVGTVISFVNMDSNAVSIAITSDTLNLAGAGTTGTRTLAQYGVATAIKVTSTGWLISGTNLT